MPVSGNTRVLAEQKLSLPLIVYYDQNRIGGLTDARSRWDKKNSNRTNALNTTPHALSDFKDWFFEKEGDEARKPANARILVMRIRKSKRCRKLWRLWPARRQSFAHESRQATRRVSFLCGRRTAWIFRSRPCRVESRRFSCWQLIWRGGDPEFPGHPIDEAPGIVCIDEIELHLHPAWQRKF